MMKILLCSVAILLYVTSYAQSIFGESQNNTGVLGSSFIGWGVAGSSISGAGVYGQSSSLYGVHAFSTSGFGLFAQSSLNDGLRAQSGSKYGVYGTSSGSHGAYFRGAGGIYVDIVLGASNYFAGSDDGVIMSDPDEQDSDIFLVSNDAVIIELDNNIGEEGEFAIWTSLDRQIFVMFENGQFKISDGSSDNNNTLLLDPSGNLVIAGTLTQGSDQSRKENYKAIDTQEVLDKLMDVPVSSWNYKNDSTPHMGPMAQRFSSGFSTR